jgi:hypothetical protein
LWLFPKSFIEESEMKSALPPHCAESLRLSVQSPTTPEAQPHERQDRTTERQSLSALCGAGGAIFHLWRKGKEIFQRRCVLLCEIVFYRIEFGLKA